MKKKYIIYINILFMQYTSIYSINKAILNAIGGDASKPYDSTYSVNLEILNLLESGSVGNPITIVSELPLPSEETLTKIYRLEGSNDLYITIYKDGTYEWDTASTKIRIRVVDELPTASSDTLGYIYFVPKEGEETDVYNEYVTIETTTEGVSAYSWEKIGSTDIDFSGYVTKDEKDADDEIIAEGFCELNAKVDDNYENLDAKINAKETKGSAKAVETKLQREIDKNNDVIAEAIADVVEMVEEIDPSNFITQDDLDAELSNYYTMGEADEEFATKDELTEVEEVVARDLNYKQDKLVSGENIATINGNSLLNGGDIVISGGSEYEIFNIYDGQPIESMDEVNDIVQRMLENKYYEISVYEINHDHGEQVIKGEIVDPEDMMTACLETLNWKVTITTNVESPIGIGYSVTTKPTKVVSDSVSNIWVGTQEQYDALTTKDANTLYIING